MSVYGVRFYTLRPVPWSTTLPEMLEPGASAHLYMLVSELQRAVREADIDPMKLVVVADTGHGERVDALSKQVRQAVADRRGSGPV